MCNARSSTLLSDHAWHFRHAGPEQQRLAVESGHWPLYRFDPRRRDQGENPLQLDSGAPKVPLKEYAYKETRYRMLADMDPERAKELLTKAQAGVNNQWSLYEQLSKLTVEAPKTGNAES